MGAVIEGELSAVGLAATIVLPFGQDRGFRSGAKAGESLR